ncbi:MAG: 16S rRNA (cytidine(1402)-2'-O)-methyltransferase [Nostocoides sp.]
MTTVGALVMAATPIGDVRDASTRLAEELSRADIVAAEDTRRLRRLCRELAVAVPHRVVSYHDHNEAGRAADLIDAVRHGARVVLVTDAGMPSVSDPGYRLVQAAIAADVEVTCIPGPSAVLTALVLSGLPMDRFCFEGFLPRKDSERRKTLAGLVTERRTMVFFEAPRRTAVTLQDLAAAFGEQRHGAVCRELTKVWEEIRRGTLAELMAWAEQEIRGEITLVIHGAPPASADLDAAVRGIRERVAAGERLKDVCGEVAAATGLKRKALYDAVVGESESR